MKKIISLLLAVALLATSVFVVTAEDWADETYALTLKIGTLSSDDDGNLITEPLEDGTALVPGESYTAWIELASTSEVWSVWTCINYPKDVIEVEEGATNGTKNSSYMKMFNEDWIDYATWGTAANAPGTNCEEPEYAMFDANTINKGPNNDIALHSPANGRIVVSAKNNGYILADEAVEGSIVLFAFDFTVSEDAAADADASMFLTQEKSVTVVTATPDQLSVYPKLNNVVATDLTIGGAVTATATPAPTATPTAAPTATPAPTEAPTATPAPTEAPTATPAPTAAPTAAPAIVDAVDTENVLTSADVAAKAFTAFAKIANIDVADVAEFGIKFASGDAEVTADVAKAGTAYKAEGALADGSYSVRLINGEGEVDYFEAAYAGFIPYMVIDGVEYFGAFTTLK